MMQLQVLPELPVALVSAFIGGLLAVLGNLALEWYRGWVKRRRLRRNLAVEIREIMKILDDMYEEDDPDDNIGKIAKANRQWRSSHPFYDSHRENIMSLSAYEIRKLDGFYRWVDHVRRELHDSEYVVTEEAALFSRMTYHLYVPLYQHLTGNVIRRVYNYAISYWKIKTESKWNPDEPHYDKE